MTKFFLSIVAVITLSGSMEMKAQKNCKLVPNNNGFAVVCKSNVSSHPPKPKIHEKQERKHKKLPFSVECKEMQTNSTGEKNSLALEAIMMLNCPLNMFLRGMKIERNETNATMKYTCCTWVPMVS